MSAASRLTGRVRWVGAGAVVLAAGAVVVVGLGLLSPTQAAPDDTAAGTSLATVERRTLIAQEAFSGTLGYSGELRVVNELETIGNADVSSLNQAVTTAHAAYDNAVRTLAAIKKPTAQNVAAARAQVRSAEAGMLSAQIAAKGATSSQLEAATAQLAQAQVALASARASANGPTPSQLASAHAQLAQAQAGLIAAQNAAAGPTAAQRTQAEAAVAHAQINLNADNQALNAARDALADCGDPASCSSAQQSVMQAQARVASDEQDLQVAQAQLSALSTAASQAEANAALASAQAQVATAQAALDAFTAPDTTANAQGQLAAAEAVARSAQAALEELTSADAKAQRDSQVGTARANLLSAQASLAAILHPTAAALAEARSNVRVTKASLDESTAKLDELRGTVTWLPELGAIVERGGPLYELDGQPSGLLLYGSRPAWRSMALGDDGEDVRQLQENLIALGFTRAGFTASRTFGADTKTAVKAWQKHLGRAQTGVVELGDVVFQVGAVRVAGQSVSVGETVTAGTQVLSATSTERVVTVDLDADKQSLVSSGDEVQVDLPDGTSAGGHVDTVGSVATSAADGQGSPTIKVTIALDDPAASGTIDQAPVDVQITTLSRGDVLAVPVNALLALIEGGYAVEVAATDGSTHLAGVGTGIFQDGWVEVEPTNGGLTEGDQVVVPS